MSRLSEGYEPRFDIDLTYGREGEVAVLDIIEGIKSSKTEVKRDAVFHKTGNIYVEYACKINGQWFESGIRTTSAEYWVFVLGNSGVMVTIQIDKLKDLAKNYYYWCGSVEEKDGSHPTKGIVIPVTAIIQQAQKWQQP